jgi:hypothetical protein
LAGLVGRLRVPFAKEPDIPVYKDNNLAVASSNTKIDLAQIALVD